MAQNRGKRDAVAAELDRLRALCDTGYALAIHIRLTRPSLMYQTYDNAWSEHYSAHGMMLSDPVVHFGLTQTGRVTWDSLADKDSEGVLRAAKDFGLHNGWTYATGTAGDKTIAGMTRSDRPHTPEEVEEIIAIVERLHQMTEDVHLLPPEVQEELRKL